MNTNNETPVTGNSPKEFVFPRPPETPPPASDNNNKTDPGEPQKELGAFLDGSDQGYAKPEGEQQPRAPESTPDPKPQAASQSPAPIHRRPSPPEQQTLPALTAGLLALVLAVACVAIWMVRDLGKQVDALEARYVSQKTTLHGTRSDSGADTNADLPSIESLRDDIALLKQRNNDHELSREQLRLAMDESQQQMLEEFIIRIVALEQGIGGRNQVRQPPVDESPRPTADTATPESPPVVAKLDVPAPEETPAAIPAPIPAPDPTPSPAPAAKPAPEVKTAQAAKPKPTPASGPWVVNLLSASTRTEAGRKVEQLSAKGIDAEIQPAVVKDQTWYRIRVVGFATVGDARRFGRKVAKEMGLKGVWDVVGAHGRRRVRVATKGVPTLLKP